MNFMFDLEDASNDGTIDAREFAEVCSCYGTDKKECEKAFAKMSKVRRTFVRFVIISGVIFKFVSTHNYTHCLYVVLFSYRYRFLANGCLIIRQPRARRKWPGSSSPSCGRSSSPRRTRARPEISFLAIWSSKRTVEVTVVGCGWQVVGTPTTTATGCWAVRRNGLGGPRTSLLRLFSVRRPLIRRARLLESGGI